MKRQIYGILGMLVLLGVITTRPALAHPIVVQTDPPDGASLAQAPGQVRLFLNQPVLLDFTTIELVDGDGRAVTPPVVLPENTASKSANNQSTTLLIKLPALTPNTYRLAWKTRSEEDFHVTTGAMVFGIQRPVNEAAGASAATLPSWPDVSLRWLNFMAVACLIGFLGLLILNAPFSNKDFQLTFQEKLGYYQRRLLKLVYLVGWAAFASGGALMTWQGFSDNFTVERWWELLTGTSFGQRWLVGEVLLGLMLALLYSGSSRLQTPAYRWVISIFLTGLAGTASQNTHAGRADSLPVFNFLADGFHLAAASVWLGGLTGLALIIGPDLAQNQSSASKAGWLILRRYSKLAALSVPVLAITGFYKSGQQIFSLDSLLTTLYGQVLLVKFQLVLFAALIGLINTLLLHPRLRSFLRLPSSWRFFKPRYLRRALLVEGLTLSVVMFLAAFLSATEPARGPEFEPAPASASQAILPNTFSTAVDDLIINLAVKPNRPGRNFLDLNIYNTRRPAPAPLEKVTIILRSPAGKETTLELPKVEDNRFQLSDDQFQIDGNWQIGLVIDRPNTAPSKTSFGWQILPSVAYTSRRPVVFSNQSLQPWLNLAAGLVLLITALFWFCLKSSRWALLRRPLTTLINFVAVRRS